MNRISMCAATAIAASAFAVASTSADASCGSAFCLVNTNWNVQGVWTEPGARVDLRYEYINQEQPRAGSDRVAVGQIPRDHDEVRTLNRNWIGTFDYTFNSQWGVSATLPLVDRRHEHIPTDGGERIPETWNFTEPGDLRVLGRYLFPASANSAYPSSLGVTFGLKLPTGRFTVRNDEGERAERSLQPGTGTTDGLLGAFYRAELPNINSSWFVQALWQRPLNSRSDYQPGQQFLVDAGFRYAVTPRVGALLQLNTQIKGRDRGLEAEPEDTGGKFVFLSPGVSVAIGPRVQLFGFFQKPIYQHVNGVQLTANWSATAGISARF